MTDQDEKELAAFAKRVSEHVRFGMASPRILQEDVAKMLAERDARLLSAAEQRVRGLEAELAEAKREIDTTWLALENGDRHLNETRAERDQARAESRALSERLAAVEAHRDKLLQVATPIIMLARTFPAGPARDYCGHWVEIITGMHAADELAALTPKPGGEEQRARLIELGQAAQAGIEVGKAIGSGALSLIEDTATIKQASEQPADPRPERCARCWGTGLVVDSETVRLQCSTCDGTGLGSAASGGR